MKLCGFQIVLASADHADDRQNRSFVLRAVQDVAFEDRPVPKLTSSHDVRVHIAQTGICGSDVHSFGDEDFL